MSPSFPQAAALPRRWGLVLAALVVPAWLLVAPWSGAPSEFPGEATLPYGPVTLNLHWQLHTRGWVGLVADDLHGFPLRTDRILTDGVPVDALSSWPFTAALGFAPGMWAWVVAVFWTAGAAAAWLGMRWWGTAGAGAIAGVGFLVGEGLLREVGEGRPTQAFAAIFLPLALGFGVEAARRSEARAGTSDPTALVPAIAAGLGMAVATLSSWGMGPAACLLGFGPLVWTATRSRGRAGGPALAAGLAAAAVLLGPAVAWCAAGRGGLPSLGMDPWRQAVLGLHPVRPVDLAMTRIYGFDGVILRTIARPVLVGAAVWVAWRAPRRLMAAPAVLACLLALLGLGSYLPGPLVLPWGWMQSIPFLSRLWWPDRNWIGVALLLALLAAGAPRRLAPLLGVALFVEAVALSPMLPFGRISLEPSPSARVLATVPDVPLVLLPAPEGPLRPDRLDLIDQLHHGRPLAGGTRAPFDLTASDAVLRGWRNNAGLRGLLACEMGEGGPSAGAAGEAASGEATGGEALVQAGLREVYLDPRYLGLEPPSPSAARGATYVACVEAVLAGWSRTVEPPLVRYRAP